jgi:hypothetical protein
MRVSEHGILNCGEPGTCRAITTFPTVTSLNDATLLATYRVGTTKDSADETVEFRRSDDGGCTWSDPVSPFGTTVEGIHGSLKVVYVTQMANEHLIAAALWVDREAHPGKPLFNDETEGCLPLAILLADSHDLGQTWSPWRVLPLPDAIGPPSLTSPLLRLPSGKLALSVETNKSYEDSSRWYQHVVYAYSDDGGQSWGVPVTVCQDPTARIFHWDQRAGVCPNGKLVTFTWTYDRETNRYLNVQRRLSSDEGVTWSTADDLGFADQPSHPAILADGRVVVAWVDRFHTRSIRARLSEKSDAPFLASTEAVIYQQEFDIMATSATERNTGELLAEMSEWSFGLPYAASLPDGDVIVVYYEGTVSSMKANWARLSI